MSKNFNSSPIIILGAARSGTTMLAETILAKHPQTKYWNEPNYIWRAFSPFKTSDLIDESECTESYIKFIRDIFIGKDNLEDGKRLLEKTPANCLRGPAIRKIFPDAKFIHVIRDGRSVVKSAANEWKAKKTNSLDSIGLRKKSLLPRIIDIFKQESSLAIRFSHWRLIIGIPFYFIRFIQMLIRQTFNNSRIPWGPRIPGMSEIRRSYGLYEACAYQWCVCTQSARCFGAKLPQDQYLEIRFEDIVLNPKAIIEDIIRFLDLSPFGKDELDNIISSIQSKNIDKADPEIEQISKCIDLMAGHLLQELGYFESNNQPSKKP